MSDWKLVHEDKGTNGTTKVFQDSNGNVRVDSYMGDVRNPSEHDRFTLNTRNGGSVSGHGFNHEDKFDSAKDNSRKK